MDVEDAKSFAPWSLTAVEVANRLNVVPTDGLSDNEVTKRRKEYGPNEFTAEEGQPIWKLFLAQFDDALVKVLLLAAAVSLGLALFDESSEEEGLRAFIEPAVILLILILNAAVGVWQEANAESALEALKDMQPHTTSVLRDGVEIHHHPVQELVPGDIITLSVGDKVPADCRLLRIHTATLRAEQSSLTGESMPVNKFIDPVPQAKCELQAKGNMLFSSTAIANGKCTAVVTTIGMQTEVGNIHQDIQAAAEEDSDTPLKRKLNDFGELLAMIIFYICAAVWLINYSHFVTWEVLPGSIIPDLNSVQFSVGKSIYYFKIAVALAVAAIPEGLPAVITTCLALGTRKMAKQNAIIRRLPSVETLGCTTVICTDKTGTLTTNQMSVVTLFTFLPNGTRAIKVQGWNYNPSEGGIDDVSVLDNALNAFGDVCAVCNDASIAADDTGKFSAVGAPTEAALVVVSEKLGLVDPEQTIRFAEQRRTNPQTSPQPVTASRRQARQRFATLEFDRTRKSMSVIVSSASSRTNELLVKGAPEGVLDRCTHVMLPNGEKTPLTAAMRKTADEALVSLSNNALRCLAFATKSLDGTVFADYNGSTAHKAHKALQDVSQYSSIESGLTLVGLAGLQDPPRPEVRGAIDDCTLAGVRVIVITGDNKNTADAVCRAINVFQEKQPIGERSMTARDFSNLNKAAKLRMLRGPNSLCFSRAEPRDKQDIVRLLREQGEIVAMTGDGVNDAPALKLADIGVAMGIAGTEVAKEASDMVLADDNFSTIVSAVCEGRSIFDNMKAFIRYMISSNIGEVASIFITAMLGMPEGMIPVQLLWVNLVTDGPPATALGFNPADPDVMLRPPRNPQEPLITVWVLMRYLVVGVYVGLATVGIFAAWYLFPSLFGIPITADGHSTVSWYQLTNFDKCESWSDFRPAMQYTIAGGETVSWSEPCDYFGAVGKAKASTLSLTVLVAIEMFNALNALSEDSSLLRVPPWKNVWLLVAIVLSFSLHCLIMYVPVLASVFSIVPLNVDEWFLVVAFAAPVVLIDEVLKQLGRWFVNPVQVHKEKMA